MSTTQTITAPMPITRNLKWKRGADWSMTLRLKEDDGSIRDTTSYSATMTIKASQNGETYTSIAAVNTAAEGKLYFAITASNIGALDFGHAVYDIIITDALGGKTCPLVGDLELL